MSEKRSQYDTDPLDPDFVRRTEELGAPSRDTTRTPNEQARFNPEAEAPTRRIDDAPLPDSYPSVFAPPVYPEPPPTYAPPPAYPPPPTYQTQQPPPANYQQPGYQQHQPPVSTFGQRGHLPQPPSASRTVAGLGIPEKFAAILPYVPYHLGIAGAIIELLLVPRHETRVRFHAAQGLALQLAILAISFALQILGGLAGSRFGGSLFWLASTIFLIISMVRVWKGEPHQLAPLADATRALDERITPRT